MLLAAIQVGVARSLLLVLTFGGGQAACHQENKSTMKNDDPTKSVSHDDKLLGAQLELPGAPLEVSFEQLPRGTPGGLGPTDYVLVALIRFDKDVLARLAATAQPRPGNPPRISSLANRPWFPSVLKAAIERYDEGSVTVRGRKFDASTLLKSPYTTGYFVIVEGTNYVILSAQTS
jgi:hypothetical protein